MTLSLLASLVVTVTLPISYGFVKALDTIYAARTVKYDQMLRKSSF